MKRSILSLLLPLLVSCMAKQADMTSNLPAPYREPAGPSALGGVSEESFAVDGLTSRDTDSKVLADPSGANTAAPASPLERKVIHDASISLKVKVVKDALDSVEAISKEFGGFVLNSSKDGLDTYFSPDSAHVTLRIPDENLDKALDKLSKVGKVTSRSLRGQDVTQEYADLKLRLDSNEKLLARYQALLLKADTVQSMLEIEKEMGRVTQDIERLKGQLIYLNDRLSLSTVNVSIEKRHRPGPVGAVFYGLGWVLGKLFVLD